MIGRLSLVLTLVIAASSIVLTKSASGRVPMDQLTTKLSKLKDLRAKAKIIARIRSAELGNLGDAEPIGEALSEFRIHYGPGY